MKLTYLLCSFEDSLFKISHITSLLSFLFQRERQRETDILS